MSENSFSQASEPGQISTHSPSNCPPVVVGFRLGDPCPDLLTENEAICYLRLDTINIKHPAETLRRYRSEGLLRGTQVSKAVFYRRSELDKLLSTLTNNNRR